MLLQWDNETWSECHSWTDGKWKIFVSFTLILWKEGKCFLLIIPDQ